MRQAAGLGGTVEAAAMLGSWREPVAVASEPGDVDRRMRMWSMSKVVTMVSLLREEGWGERVGRPLTPEVESALEGAIERSENCPVRRIVVELERTAGSAEAARRAMSEVLAEAGAEAHVSEEVAPPDSGCVEYLEGQHEVSDPMAPALLLGTSTWRVTDAALFVHALGAGVYGHALTKRVLAAMRVPKGRSREAQPNEFTAPADWGAGRAFAGLEPAYKAGWGGTQQGEFLAGQMALVDFPRSLRTGVAVMFHPDVQPPVDAPGITAAGAAIELVMGSLESTTAGP